MIKYTLLTACLVIASIAYSQAHHPISRQLYWPTVNGDSAGTPIAYTSVPFRINAQYIGMHELYQIEVTLDGKPFLLVNGPHLEYTPQFGKDEGKKIKIIIRYKNSLTEDASKKYVILDTKELTIQYPPLVVGGQHKIDSTDKVVLIKVGYGIESYYTPIRSPLIVTCQEKLFFDTVYCYSSIGEQNRGAFGSFDDTPDYFELYHHSEKMRPEGYDFFVLLHPEKHEELKGRTIKYTITDPRTGMNCTKTFKIAP